MEGATVKLNRAEAFPEIMKRTAVIIAQTQARRNRASVVAVIQIVGNRREVNTVNFFTSTVFTDPTCSLPSRA
jgi:hypothetical protein